MRRLWFGLAIIIVFVALALSAFRALLPLADQYRDDFSQWIYEEHGVYLEIGALGASWRGFGPVLVLKKSTMFKEDRQGVDLKVERFELEVNLWKSLNQQTLILDDIELIGVEAAFDFGKVNTPVSDSNQDIDAVLKIFFDQLAQFSVKDSLVYITTPKGVKKPIYIERLVWKNQGQRHLAEGLISYVEGVSDNGIQVRIDANGHWKTPHGIDATLYLNADKLNLGSGLSPFVADTVVIDNGLLSFQLWAQIKQGKLVSALLDFEPSHLVWHDMSGRQNITIDDGRLEYSGSESLWQLDSFDLDVSTNEQDWAPLNLQLYGDHHIVNGAIDGLVLDSILPLTSLVKQVPEQWQSYLSSALPSGTFSKLRFSFLEQLELQADLDNFYLKAAHDKPGINNVDIHFDLTGLQGRAELDLKSTRLDFKPIFNVPFNLKSGNVNLLWQVQKDVLSLWSDKLELQTQDASMSSQFELRLPLSESAPTAFLSLYSELKLKDVAKAQLFFPNSVMDDDLENYLSSALISGQVNKSKLLWFGELDQYPYKKAEGIFQLQAEVRNGEYKFAPDWPSLTKVDLDLSFINDALYMHSNSVNLYGAHASFLNANFETLGVDSVLEIEAKVSGPSSEITRYLVDSPLDGVSKTFKALKVDGNITGKLSISIPLDERPALAKGWVNFKNNKLTIHEPLIELKALSGKLYFENDKLWSKTFRSSSLGLPFSFKLHGYEDKKSNYHLGIDLSGHWPSTLLRKKKLHSLFDHLKGKLNWQGHFAMALKKAGKFTFDLSIDSNLNALSSQLPFPFNKKSGVKLPASVEYSGDQTRSFLKAEIDNTLAYNSHYIHGKKKTINSDSWLIIGKKMGEKPKKSHVVSISLPKLDFSQWQLLQAKDKATPKKPLLTPLSIDHLEANIQQLSFYEQNLDEFKFIYQNEPNAVSIDISSKQLVGNLTLPAKPKSRIEVDFEKVLLPNLFLSERAERNSKQTIEANKLNEKVIDYKYFEPLLSRLTLLCSKCQLMQYNLGKVNLVLGPTKDGRGVKSSKLLFDMGHSKLTGAISWRMLKGLGRSHFVGEINSQSGEKLLPALGYPSPLKDTPLAGSVDINWQHSPFEFSPKTLNGVMSIEAGEGVLVEMSDKGARVLTLASLDTIWRRLRLDFNDVFQKGLFYNSIKGSYHFKDGVMTTNDLEMDAVAGKMRGQGTMDFHKENMQFYISFYPDVTSSLPVIAAFAITPVTGVAVLALSKLLEPVLEVVTELKFELNGSLDAPVLTELERKSSKVDISNKLKDKKNKSKWESDR